MGFDLNKRTEESSELPRITSIRLCAEENIRIEIQALTSQSNILIWPQETSFFILQSLKKVRIASVKHVY